MKQAGSVTGGPTAPILPLLTSKPSVLLLWRDVATILTFIFICIYKFPRHFIHSGSNWSCWEPAIEAFWPLPQSTSVTSAAISALVNKHPFVLLFLYFPPYMLKIKCFSVNNFLAALHFLCIRPFYPTSSTTWMIDRTRYLKASIWKSAAVTRRDHGRAQRKITALEAPQSFSFLSIEGVWHGR